MIVAGFAGAVIGEGIAETVNNEAINSPENITG